MFNHFLCFFVVVLTAFVMVVLFDFVQYFYKLKLFDGKSWRDWRDTMGETN